MSLSTGVKSLEAVIKRLESAAGKRQRCCAYCRYAQRYSWPDPNRPKPRPEDVLRAKCEFCHSEYTASLANTSEETREVFRLFFSFTLKDRFTDPKAHAITLWWDWRPGGNRGREHRAVAGGKGDPDARAVAKLEAEVDRLIAQRLKKLRAQYGDPFPEHMRLVESVRKRELRSPGFYVEGLFELEKEESEHLVCAELEKIVWGEVRPGTASALERVAREIDESVRTSAEREAGRKEEARPRDSELLNKSRAQQATDNGD